MNERDISEVIGEVRAALGGRAWGRVFQLGRAALVAEFRPADGRFLLLSAEPNRPRLHLVRRSARELERDSLPPSPFGLVLRKRLGGATLVSVRKDEGERVVRLNFDAEDAAGRGYEVVLVAQLTGRSSNLFLLDGAGRVLDSLRPARGPGQEIGETYAPPAPAAHGAAHERKTAPESEPAPAPPAPRKEGPPLERAGFETLSEALDDYYLAEDRARAFGQRAGAAASKLRQEISKLTKLRANLERDLAAHGDPEAHKRVGDLLLANLATAERAGGRVRLTDYYADDAPTVEIEVDENRSLQDEAAQRFARYGKAKRAAQEIARRLAEIEAELAALLERRSELERVTAARNEAGLARLTGSPRDGGRARTAKTAKKEAGAGTPGLRRYRSSDGYEILVGRGSRDNDHLTFRLARSYDLWLHAADYPGSHVVVRAPTRDGEIPHRTVLEAAQLAAHFSRAGKDAKVAVNYAPRKLVTKPKGAAPGLVYLSGFRTLLVEPREAGERV
ncbi:MAG TPA: NFACT family protein [Pyrinomonadaceae bacterium]|nr:NFACT family protein [Pyrinomonadaceae bacterium]